MKKNKTFLIMILLLYAVPTTHAQQASVASGGVATGIGGTVNYSVGQTDYLTATGSSGTATQGVQQPFEISILGIDSFPEIVLEMTISPNPATEFVNLKINNFDYQNLNFELVDITGKQILFEKVASSETEISLINYPTKIYLLNITNRNKLIKTFKIIKN
jgi:Secretion system C-terminal sorting domain